MTEESSEGLMTHESKKLRLLYEPLCLLHSISEIRGDRIKPGDISHESPAFTGPRLYRQFVEAMAYICAYKKKPGYVTAVALEDTPEKIVVLLAANNDIDQKVITFVEKVLKVLSWITENHGVRQNTPEGRKIMQILTEYVLEFNTPKIYEYYQQVIKGISTMIQQESLVSGLEDDSMIKLREWFSINLYRNGLPLGEGDMPALALSSYRDREVFKASSNHPGSPDKSLNFERLFKLLYKLGKHVAKCKHLINATIGLHSYLARGFRIEVISSSPEKRTNLVPRTSKIENISNRVFKPEERNMFLQKLSQTCSSKELDLKLAKEAAKGKTRVHCELLVLDHFEQTNGRFLFEQDRYIGCSKPACYLCYLFISCHPRRYARPPSHQKLYMNWRLPDIYGNQPSAGIRFNQQCEILNHMIQTVRRDLKQDITTRGGQRRYCPDSTAGGTSTIVDIDCDLNLSASNNLSLEELLGELKMTDHSYHSPQSPSIGPGPSIHDTSLPSTCEVTENESDDVSDDGGVDI